MKKAILRPMLRDLMKYKYLSLIVLVSFTGCLKINTTSSSSNLLTNSSSTSISKSSTSTNDYGELIIPDMHIYTGFPDVPQPIFTNPEYASEITYTLEDGTSIEYIDGYFSANDVDVAYVDATTKYHSTTFEIQSSIYSDPAGASETNFYLNRVDSIEDRWIDAGKPTGGTLFVGDSFFDTEFWSNFYDTFKDGNTFTHGVSSSTTTDWEIFSSRLLYPVAPKNLVMHLATNNLFDDKESASVALENTQRLLETIKGRLPDIQIYYFAVEPRTYGIGTSSFNLESYNIINEFNIGMMNYCKVNKYVNFLDATSYCYKSGINVNSEFFRDGCHPKLSNYLVYIDLLKEAGLELEVSDNNDNTKEFDISYSNAIADTNNLISYNGTYISNNYSVSGKLKITKAGQNAHIQFSLDSSNNYNRFLLWDNDNNGTLEPGYAYQGVYKSNVGNAICRVNEEHTWQVITTTKHSYFFVDNNLEFIFLNLNSKEFMIGAENTSVSFYDITVTTNQDSTKWNDIINSSNISLYENDASNEVKAIIV